MVEYGPRGLDLLAKGVEPQAALAQLLADDAAARVAAGRRDRHEGPRRGAHRQENGNWAGSRQGLNYTVQANIMVGPEVVEAVAATFEATDGTGMPLAERMILAHGSRPGQGRRSPLGQPAVGRDQDCRSERSGPRRRSHRARDRSRRTCRAGRRDEAHLLHDRPPSRLSHASRASKAPTSSS